MKLGVVKAWVRFLTQELQPMNLDTCHTSHMIRHGKWHICRQLSFFSNIFAFLVKIYIMFVNCIVLAEIIKPTNFFVTA